MKRWLWTPFDRLGRAKRTSLRFFAIARNAPFRAIFLRG